MMNGFTQKPEAWLTSSYNGTPKVDGIIDSIWVDADSFPISLPFQTEIPSLGNTGETYWKSMWEENGLYFLIHIKDEVFSPCYSGCNSWEYDRPELYFDCNYELVDGGGGSNGGNGHWQVAFGYNESYLAGGTQTGENGIFYGHCVNDTSATWEYFIPWSFLVDKDSNYFIKTNPMGFDITVRDNDTPGTPGVNRAVWSNDGTGTAANESWNNMDDCGTIFLLASCKCIIPVSSITVVSAENIIDTDNGTLQMEAIVEPTGATNRNLKWQVENITGKADINQSGLLTARVNGKVHVAAYSKDGSSISGEKEITICNQVLSLNDINLLRNSDFTTDGAGFPDQWSGWLDGTGQEISVAEGVLTCRPHQYAESWHYQVFQTGNYAGWQLYNDTSYILVFDAWAAKERAITVDFEDNPTNGYTRYGDSEDTNSIGGLSEWNVTLSENRATYTQHVTMKRLVPESSHKLMFMLSGDSAEVYLDNIMLFTVGNYETFLAGQKEYLPLIDKTQTSMNFLREFPDVFTTDSVGYQKDSTIASKNYCVFRNYFSGEEYLLRTEENCARAYLLSDSMEYTVMDLTLEKGDAFVIHYMFGDQDEVILVDSVFYQEGKKHIRFNKIIYPIIGPEENFEFIEGIGTNHGLFYQNLSFPDPYSWYLLCSHKANEIQYTGKAFGGTCNVFIPVGFNQKLTTSLDASLYPNPCSDEITIKMNDKGSENYKISFFDLSGRLVKEDYFQGTECRISLNDLNAAVFILKVIDDKGNQAVFRLMKID
jgi:hypothetical protein